MSQSSLLVLEDVIAWWIAGGKGDSEFAGEGFDERKGFGEEFIPAGELADAGFFEMGGG